MSRTRAEELANGVYSCRLQPAISQEIPLDPTTARIRGLSGRAWAQCLIGEDQRLKGGELVSDSIDRLPRILTVDIEAVKRS